MSLATESIIQCGLPMLVLNQHMNATSRDRIKHRLNPNFASYVTSVSKLGVLRTLRDRMAQRICTFSRRSHQFYYVIGNSPKLYGRCSISVMRSLWIPIPVMHSLWFTRVFLVSALVSSFSQWLYLNPEILPFVNVNESTVYTCCVRRNSWIIHNLPTPW